jgi:hypothetical protein
MTTLIWMNYCCIQSCTTFFTSFENNKTLGGTTGAVYLYCQNSDLQQLNFPIVLVVKKK